MTPEAQRIAIAEACGYIGPFDTGEEWHDEGEGAFQSVILRDSRCCQVPDYLNNLNAIHEAERVLTGAEQQMRYAANLLQAKGMGDLYDAGDLNVDFCWHAATATAAQRAEAFLKTIGKWEGQP